MNLNNRATGAEGDEPTGIDWAALDRDIRSASGWPLPFDLVNAAQDDADADASLWPNVLDAKGKATAEVARPNPAAFRAALNRAAQTDPAEVAFLANAISEAEAREIIAAAAAERGHERRLDAEVTALRLDLAAKGHRRQAEHDAGLAESRRRRENRAAEALERRTRALDPTSRVVRLAAAARFVPWIAVLPAVLAAVLGAVNVGVQFDALSPGTHVINWLIEPLLTLPLLAILAAQISGAVPSGGANPYRRLERVLITVAVGLNVGLHLLVGAPVAEAAVWAIVPAGLAISAYLVPRLIGHLMDALTAAGTAEVDPPRAPREASPGPIPSQDNAVIDADRRTDAEVLDAFARAVQTGQLDPRTGRPIDPTSAESIRRTLRVGRARAAALRDEYAATTD
jgi:hypothetical protein